MQNKIFKGLTFILLFFISIMISTQPAFAEANTTQIMRISPIVLKVFVSPGSTQTFKIKIDNLLKTPLPLRISVDGLESANEEEGITITNQKNSPLASWIELNSPDIIIPAKETHEVEARVLIPKAVPIGGYGAMIFFSPVLPSNTVAARVAVVLLANVGVAFDKKNNGEVVQFSLDKKLYQESPIKTTIRVKNTSLNFFSAKPTLRIKPLFGETKIFELEEKTILPGKIRHWEKSYNIGKLYHGFYTASLVVSLEKGDFIYSQSYFFGFPLNKVISISLLVMLMLYGILFRKRLLKALRIFLKG